MRQASKYWLFLMLMACALYAPLHSYAQRGSVAMRIPIISLGRIRPPEIKNGKAVPTPTTRQAIFKNALLLGDLNNVRVVAYKFSLIAPGQGFYGPVYVTGGELTDSLKTKIKLTPGPDVKIYIEDVRMLYRGDTMDGNNVYLQYDQ